MERILNSLLQLITLGIGIAIGILIAPRFEHKVIAQAATPLYTPGLGADPTEVSPTITPIAPTMTAPSIGANILLAHELQVDHAVVNGYDLLKIDENILNYLGAQPLGNHYELANIISRSKASELYTLAPPPKPPAPVAPVPPK